MAIFGQKISAILREIIGGGEQRTSNVQTSASYEQQVVSVNSAEQAMQIAAVYRCVDLVSSGVAVMQLHYMRKNTAKGYFCPFDPTKEYEKEGAMLDYLLSVKPNDKQNAFTFLKYTVAQKLLRGNALWIPKRDIYGHLEQLILVTQGTFAFDKLRNKYVVADNINGIYGEFNAEDVFHFKNLSMDGGYWGQSTISYGRRVMTSVATADKEVQNRLATGGRFRAILSNDTSVRGFGEYEDEELQKLADSIQTALKSGRDIISHPGDVKFQPITMTSADLEFMQTRVYETREIARLFGVPLIKLGETSNSNYKSVEMEQMDFYNEALQPQCVEIQNEILAKTTTKNTYNLFKVMFDTTSLFAMDVTSKAAWMKSRLETGVATVNDLRRENLMPPVEGGDEVLMSCNVAPLGSEKLGSKPTTTKDSE